ncbi:protein of unknown function [Ruminococcaceae bacterium BL-6]|nr:protein of unknown function [Ruminococcaceae bacterium BL-6]
MPRRKSYIKQLNARDQKILSAFYCCQHLSQQQITSIVTKNRLKSYIKQGIVVKQNYIPKHVGDSAHPVYALTKSGRQYIRCHISKMRNTAPYHSSSAPAHNIRLSEIYLSETKNENAQWLTERDLQQLFLDTIQGREDERELLDALRTHTLSPPDGAVLCNGEVTLIEIVSVNYSQEEISAKQTYSDYMSMPIEFYRV